jgi:hypothetical protein
MTMEGESIDEIRERALALKIEDLARQGYADVTHWRIGARDVTIRGSNLVNEDVEDSSSPKKRPSGWYRPL